MLQKAEGKTQIRTVGEGSYLIEGNIDFGTVLSLREQAEKLIDSSNGCCSFDWSAVGQVNTAALSLVLCLRRKAASSATEIHFTQLPNELLSIARMSDLEALLK
jgi:phospholipid transport system transporter-binding protein